MSKRIILRCDGLLEKGFGVTLEVRGTNTNSNSNHYPVLTEAKGFLPPAMELIQLLSSWQQNYSESIGVARILLENIGTSKSTMVAGVKCRQLAQELRKSLIEWLKSAQFQPIELRLRESLGINDSVEILLRTNDLRLHKLPWHLWDFIERYPQSEMMIGNSAELINQPIQPHHQVRVLAILGDRRGVDIEADRKLLANIPQAEVCFLVEPSQEELHKNLWDQTWDILFFAGHSNTEQQQGRIYLSEKESLTIDDLRHGLRQAIGRGLQLAIFNSCDGLGLAYELEELHIPQTIIMREPVPDRVAVTFLKQFLGNFSSGASLHIAVRKAREYLQGLEREFPCASWLPIIFQNPALPILSWSDLQGETGAEPLSIPKKKLMNKQLTLLIILASFIFIGYKYKSVESVNYFHTAMEKDKHGDYDGALNDYNKAIELDSMSFEAYKNRGILKFRHFNDISGAINDYSKAIEVNPKSPYAYDHRGYLQANNLNNTSAALADYNKAIELDPKFLWAYYNRGVLKDKKMNDTSGALADYNKVIDLDPGYVNAYYNRGVLKDKKINDLLGALADYNRAIELDPKFSWAYFQRSSLKKKLGLPGSIEDQEEATRLFNLQDRSGTTRR